ncbi:MAG TPA: proline--tRNA ligase [Candidatus Brocadiia bacterium]|nr:proline--tRNA ligase [Candidatus Brocadiia bacterium]
MRWSKTLIPTLKEQPAEAEVRSHSLMIRAGLIRRLGAGLYDYLPAGMRSLLKATAIVRQEMDRAGALEILMPVVWPQSLVEESGRLDVFGDLLIRFKDRNGRPHILAPTHEETVTDIVRNEVNSYRQLPINLYHIQTKFRDEIRPRFGVLRSREFIMKDAYSFDADAEGLNRSYQLMYDAYVRVFKRCGLKCIAVEADTGAMGGDASHEFMVPSPIGDDLFVRCEECGYAANLERAEIRPLPDARSGKEDKLECVDTPNQRTIEQVTAFLGCRADRMIKTLIYVADGKPVAALVRGDHEVNEVKLKKTLGAKQLELADEATIRAATSAPVGFAGPVGIKCRVICDQAVTVVNNCVTGANKADAHIINVNMGRDWKPDVVADIRVATNADLCPKCGKPFKVSNGVEIGHVFKLGTKYSDALGAKFLDAEGKEKSCIMGCYGIGVNRLLAARIEQANDDNGIIWSRSLAPYEAAVIPTNVTDPAIFQAAEKVYAGLMETGVDTILDDRDQSPGFKFKDSDLVGFPLKVIIGKKFQKTGEMELKLRSGGEAVFAAADNVVQKARQMLDSCE